MTYFVVFEDVFHVRKCLCRLLLHSRKCHTYSRRQLPALSGRTSRRTASDSACISRARYTSTEDDEDEDDDDEDDSSSSQVLAKITTAKLGVSGSRRSSEDAVATSNSSHLQTPKKRTSSVDSRTRPVSESSNSGINCSKDVETSPGPSARLRNHSSSSNTTPKSPSKGGRNRSPSVGDVGSENDTSSKEQDKSDENQKDFKKMTREEKKIAAYMKAFEMMEKAAQRKQENDRKKVEESGKGKKSDDDDDNTSCDETFTPSEKQRKKV